MPDQSNFHQNAERFLRAKILWPGEKIKWSGRPDLRRTIWFKWGHCLIGSLLLLLTLPLYSIPAHIRDLDFFATVIFFGLLWLALTPARNYFRAGRTAYFVTNKRLFIIQNFNPEKATILSKDDITDYQMTRLGGNRGDIQLKINRSRLPNLYEEDKRRMFTNMNRLVHGNALLGPVIASPFVTYSDGFWGVENVSDANTAIKDIVEAGS